MNQKSDMPRPPFVLRLLPCFTDFAFLMPLVFLFGRMHGLRTLLGDGDTGWHIRAGEWIIANGKVPSVDFFSYSRPGEPWFAWEWLADIVLAGLNAAGGLRAVALFGIVILAVTITLLFHLVRRKSNVVVAIMVTIVASAASSIHWLARPHLFTLLFLVLFYGALERVREGRTRIAGIPYLVLLPVVTVLWTNLHGGFIAGIVMVGAYGMGELLQLVFSERRPGRRDARRRAYEYLLCAAACLAASLINPYFYHLHVHMAAYLRNPWNGQHIMEFFSPSFHHPNALFLEAMLVLAAAAAYSASAKGRFIEPLLICVWAHGALLAARNIPIFMIVAAPPVAALIHEWLMAAPEWRVAGWLRSAVARFNRLASETGETEAVGRWHLTSIAGVVVVAALMWAPNPPKNFRAEFDPDRYPAAAVDKLRHDREARIFTNDEWGDYLIWKLYPTHKVFIDGRSDFYGNAFEEKFADVLNVKHGWAATLDQFGVDTILMPPDAPLSGALKESARWRVVYDDGIAVVFRSAAVAGGGTISVASASGGTGRDREITKPKASDRAITTTKSKT